MSPFRPFLLISVAAFALAGCGSTPGGSSLQPTGGATVAAASDAAQTQKSHLYATLDILGIGPVYEQRLGAAKVRTALDLLEQGRTRDGRARLAAATGISPKLILRWVNHADLMRILQTGPVYARMLEDAGVDTVPELASRNPQNLRDGLDRVRQKGGKTMVERVPKIQTLSTWISRARDLGRYVEY